MNILSIGYGAMASAILSRLSSHALFAVDPSPKAATNGVSIYPSLADIPATCTPDVILIAVKPQQLAEALAPYAARFSTKPLYVSIAAGKSLATLEALLSAQARIIRAMPNTPAAIGEGITALIANSLCTADDRAQAEAIFAAVGHALWLENEGQMHAVTALSGSGPAYVFLFLEALVEAGTRAGLPADMAKTLALATVKGSSMLAGNSGETFHVLRENVTSKGGTTEAALAVLMQNDALKSLLASGMDAAQKRSISLGN